MAIRRLGNGEYTGIHLEGGRPHSGRHCFSTSVPSITICIPGHTDGAATKGGKTSSDTISEDPRLADRMGFARINTR